MSSEATRFWVKRIARGSVAAVASSMPRHSGEAVRVLTYHRFGRRRFDPFCVSPEDFDEQMAWLASTGRAVSLDDVFAFAQGNRDLPEDACLVSIDDGFASMHDVAFPILAKHRLPAVMFITANFVGAPHVAALPEPFLSVDALREMHSAGIAIGSHAFDHVSMGRLSRSATREQMRASKERLEDLLGARVTAFAYPFGVYGDFDDETDRMLSELGYEIAFNSEHGAIRRGDLALRWRSLPRIKIEAGKPMWQFRSMTRGAMDGWVFVDRNLGRLRKWREATHAVL